MLFLGKETVLRGVQKAHYVRFDFYSTRVRTVDGGGSNSFHTPHVRLITRGDLASGAVNAA